MDSAETIGSQTILSDSAMRLVLEALATRFKGIDPEVDKRIDAHAASILGLQGSRVGAQIKSIAPEPKNAPRVPLYFKGAPGEGKTSAIREACKAFCKIAGLTFITDPPPDYVFGPKDFFYAEVNLAGQNTIAAAAGGILMRTPYGETGRATSALFLSALRGAIATAADLAGAAVGTTKKLPVVGGKGERISVAVDNAKAALMAEKVAERMSDFAAKQGMPFKVTQPGVETDPEAINLQVLVKDGQLSFDCVVPPRVLKDEEYVASVLPSLRFHQVSKARFALVNFDDVANAMPGLVDACLSLAQFNRYAGVADLGNAYVTFTGNLGAGDNTNARPISDALTTRCAVYEVEDSRQAWSARVTRQYAQYPGAALYMPEFIEAYGEQDGVFRDKTRQAKGIPKANSRSLVNALVHCRNLIHLSNTLTTAEFDMYVVPMIEVRIKATAGARVAAHFIPFLRQMFSGTIDFAKSVMRTGTLNESDFAMSRSGDPNAAIGGTGLLPREKDFDFRFGAALAQAACYDLTFNLHERIEKLQAMPQFAGKTAAEIKSDLVQDVVANLVIGSSYLPDSSHEDASSPERNFLFARFAQMLEASPDYFPVDPKTNLPMIGSDVVEALGNGLRIGAQKAGFDNAECDRMIATVVSIVTGSNYARRVVRNQRAAAYATP